MKFKFKFVVLFLPLAMTPTAHPVEEVNKTPSLEKSDGREGFVKKVRFRLPLFEDFDSNGDGFVEKQEFYDFRTQRMSERKKAGYPMRRLSAAPTFDDIDIDADGKINPKEFGRHQQSYSVRTK